MLKVKLYLLLMLSILNTNTFGMDLMTNKLTPKRVVIGVATILAAYGIYKKYQKAQNFKTEAKRINEEVVQNFKIDEDTVFAFDIHKVVANYNILKMILTGLKNPIIALAIFYPKIYSAVYSKLNAGASVQEALEKVEREYPDSNIIKQIKSKIIEIAAQLKPIYGTIEIIEQLKANEYKVVFISNMEPELWKKFVVKFPQFKTYPHFLRQPNPNNIEEVWLKKPKKEYFDKFLIEHGKVSHVVNMTTHFWGDVTSYNNVLFIDDQLKNIYGAQKAKIPSYVFTNPEQLAFDLSMMGADLDVKYNPQDIGMSGSIN